MTFVHAYTLYCITAIVYKFDVVWSHSSQCVVFTSSNTRRSIVIGKTPEVSHEIVISLVRKEKESDPHLWYLRRFEQ